MEQKLSTLVRAQKGAHVLPTRSLLNRAGAKHEDDKRRGLELWDLGEDEDWLWDIANGMVDLPSCSEAESLLGPASLPCCDRGSCLHNIGFANNDNGDRSQAALTSALGQSRPGPLRLATHSRFHLRDEEKCFRI
jgi:hypothetical protein